MMSQTHSLMALALLSKRGDSRRNWVVFLGSVIPDAFIYIFWVWFTFIIGAPQSEIWDELYFEPLMQTLSMLFNSIPIYATIAIVGWVFREKVWGALLLVFALAALLHVAFDLPFHNHDAHAHFWPLTDWKFISPLSYWEIAFWGNLVGLAEAVIGLICIAILWQKFDAVWVRALLMLFSLVYIATTIMLFFMGEGAQ